MNTTLNRCIVSASVATCVVAIMVALVTIVGEEYAPLKDWLKATFSHHWLGKSYLANGAFLASMIIAYPFTRTVRPVTAVKLAVICTTLSTVALLVYFALHTLHFV